MISPYFLRLAALCFASFFMVHAALGLAVRLAAPLAIRRAERMQSRGAARLLFTLRALPLFLSAAFIFGLCVPSYLLFEPNSPAEHVGVICSAAAILGVAIWLISISRAVHGVVQSARYVRRCDNLRKTSDCLGGRSFSSDMQRPIPLGVLTPGARFRFFQQPGRQTGATSTLQDQPLAASVVETEAPLVALAGLFGSRLIISRGILCALSADQLDAVLRHEHAHQNSRDNFKRLILLLAPELFPFSRGFARVEHAWARFTEWAADDEAARGDTLVSLSLAGALVRVARMGAAPQPSPLLASLLPGDQDLAARVNRLLDPEQPAPKSTRRLGLRALAVAAASVTAVYLLSAIAWPGTLYAVHHLLERLIG